MNTKNLILGFALSLTILSCNKEETGSPISAEDAKVSAQIDAMNDDVSNIVEEQETITYDNSTSGKTSDLAFSELTSCATITRVPDFGTPLTPGQTVTKTIDFGSGCTLDNGNVVSGQIVITFVFQPDAPSHTINYSFVNFFHNGIEFNGNKTFTRTIVPAAGPLPAHPRVVMNLDMTATLPSGAIYHRVGERVREIIDGITTPTWADNIYKITGHWTTTTPSGATQESTITTELHVKMSCVAVNKPLIVSGVVTIVRGDTSATLDFGDGQCDNLAVFTVNGNSYDIVIGN
jgi:hypothetical protein